MGFVVSTIVLLTIIFVGVRFYRSTLSARNAEGSSYNGVPPLVPGLAAGAAALALVVVTLLQVFVIVSPGYVGVPIFFGSTGEPLPNGLRIVNPLTSVNHMSVRTESYAIAGPHGPSDEMTQVGGGPVNIITKDDLSVNVDLTILYSLVSDDASFVYTKFGDDYTEKLVRSPVHAIARDVGSSYSFRDLYSSREAAEKKMQQKLSEIVQGLVAQQDPSGKRVGILIQQVLVKRITPPERLIAAITAKKEAEQEAERMVFVIQKAKMEAERKSIEADGIAVFQTKVSQGIDENLLVWKGIEATEELAKSGNAKVVIIGNPGNGLPLMLGDLMRELNKQEPGVTAAANK